MNLSQIKNLVKRNGDKFIFLENGEPELVVMSFQEYEKLNGLPSADKRVANFGLSRKTVPELVDFGLEDVEETEFLPPHKTIGNNLPARTEGVRLEDLPI